MANYCDFSMKVVGLPEKVQEFVDILKGDSTRHMYRIFKANILCEEALDQNKKAVLIKGFCAWNINGCMTNNGICYFNQAKQAGDKNGTTLQKESQNLCLEIEVFSSEPGMGVQEHLLYKNGKELENQCIDYQEFFLNEEDVEKFNEENRTNFKPEDFDDEGIAHIGGFENYGEFSI